MGRRCYPAEFRRKVLDLLADGRSVASVAHDPEVSGQTIYSWRKQDRIDRRLAPELGTKENGELAAARKRISELENGLAIAQRAVDLLEEQTSPKGDTRQSRRVVGWSIDSSPTAALVTNALGMAIDTRLGKASEAGTTSTATKESNSVPGPSPRGLETPACLPRWAASATATTTP